MNFWKDECHEDIKIVQDPDTSYRIEWVYSNNTPNESLRGTIRKMRIYEPETYGKGEWEAKTLEDAKQMAKDFAKGVN